MSAKGDNPSESSQSSLCAVGFNVCDLHNNILFGEAFDEQRHKAGAMCLLPIPIFALMSFEVLKGCGLERELSLLKARDLTEVGEKGPTLRCVDSGVSSLRED